MTLSGRIVHEKHSKAEISNNLGLSPKEFMVLTAASDGLTDKEIARKCALSIPTVKTYWSRIRQKIGTVNRTQSVAYYFAHKESEGPRVGIVRFRVDGGALVVDAPNGEALRRQVLAHLLHRHDGAAVVQIPLEAPASGTVTCVGADLDWDCVFVGPSPWLREEAFVQAGAGKAIAGLASMDGDVSLFLAQMLGEAFPDAEWTVHRRDASTEKWFVSQRSESGSQVEPLPPVLQAPERSAAFLRRGVLAVGLPYDQADGILCLQKFVATPLACAALFEIIKEAESRARWRTRELDRIVSSSAWLHRPHDGAAGLWWLDGQTSTLHFSDEAKAVLRISHEGPVSSSDLEMLVGSEGSKELRRAFWDDGLVRVPCLGQGHVLVWSLDPPLGADSSRWRSGIVQLVTQQASGHPFRDPLFEAAFRHLPKPAILFALDRSHRLKILSVNSGVAGIWGGPPEEMEGAEASNLITAETTAFLLEAALMLQGQPSSSPGELISVSGAVIPVCLAAKAFTSSAGRLLVVLVDRDRLARSTDQAQCSQPACL